MDVWRDIWSGGFVLGDPCGWSEDGQDAENPWRKSDGGQYVVRAAGFGPAVRCGLKTGDTGPFGIMIVV